MVVVVADWSVQLGSVAPLLVLLMTSRVEPVIESLSCFVAQHSSEKKVDAVFIAVNICAVEG